MGLHIKINSLRSIVCDISGVPKNEPHFDNFIFSSIDEPNSLKTCTE